MRKGWNAENQLKITTDIGSFLLDIKRIDKGRCSFANQQAAFDNPRMFSGTTLLFFRALFFCFFVFFLEFISVVVIFFGYFSALILLSRVNFS